MSETVSGADRYKAGVMEYKKMGFWEPDYEPKDTDLICLFRITPQDGRGPGGSRGGGCRRVLHRHLDRCLDRPAHRLRAVPRQGLPRGPGADQRGAVLRVHRL